MATQKLLEAAKDTNIKKLVYVSSSSAYGDTDKSPMQETNRLQPVSPNGVSRLAAENRWDTKYVLGVHISFSGLVY